MKPNCVRTMIYDFKSKHFSVLREIDEVNSLTTDWIQQVVLWNSIGNPLKLIWRSADNRLRILLKFIENPLKICWQKCQSQVHLRVTNVVIQRYKPIYSYNCVKSSKCISFITSSVCDRFSAFFWCVVLCFSSVKQRHWYRFLKDSAHFGGLLAPLIYCACAFSIQQNHLSITVCYSHMNTTST